MLAEVDANFQNPDVHHRTRTDNKRPKMLEDHVSRKDQSTS
jgi:hypothetical protein